MVSTAKIVIWNVGEFAQPLLAIHLGYIGYKVPAEKIEREICTIVEPGETPESHLRELAPLKDQPDVARDVMGQLLQYKGAEKITAADVVFTSNLWYWKLEVFPRSY